MPFPVSLPPVGSPAGSARHPRRIVALLLTAAALAGCAVVLDAAAGVVGLVLALAALAALGAAAALAARARWVAAGQVPAPRPVPAQPRPDEDRMTDDALTARLQLLKEMTTEKVNQALELGREDVAHELSDAYADEALRLITAAGLPPAAPRR